MTGVPSRPVSVLQVLAQDDLGGTELMLENLIERLNPNRVRCDLAVLSAPGPISARLRAAGITVHGLGERGTIRATARLGRLLRDSAYDIVNAYGLKASLVTRIVARLMARQTKVVVGVRGLLVTEVQRVDSPKARLAMWLERATSALVDLYDSNSRGAADLMISSGVDPERVRYIPNGIDLCRWRAQDGMSAADTMPLIASVARFTPRKRQQDLLESLALLRNDGVPFRAILAGAGPTLEACRQLAADLELTDTVQLPGQISPRHVAVLLTKARVGCLASLWEGMPGFIMEAMAAGLPVVATAVNGCDELVITEETGLLVPAEDPKAMMRALARILKNPTLAARMGCAGRERIGRHFSLDSMVSAKQNLYEELVRR